MSEERRLQPPFAKAFKKSCDIGVPATVGATNEALMVVEVIGTTDPGGTRATGKPPGLIKRVPAPLLFAFSLVLLSGAGNGVSRGVHIVAGCPLMWAKIPVM